MTNRFRDKLFHAFLRKASPTSDPGRIRFVIIALSVFLLFSLLIIQFYKIQVIEHGKWTQIAKSQHQTVVVEPFRRGVFYSNTSIKEGHPEEMQPFVVDVLKFHLHIDPMMLPDSHKREIQNAIVEILNLQEDITPHFYKKSRSRKVASWITSQKKQEIESFWNSYAKKNKISKNAIYFVKDYQRSYPFGHMLGQVLHTVREDRDHKTHQAIPTGGLEMVFHGALKGKEGKKVILRSPRFELDSDLMQDPPQDGMDVYLTINHCIQAIAEEELARGVKKVNAKGGIAVMMDPYTGEIWSIAQYPFFNPASYREYYNDPILLESTKNKAISDCFEPGSTMKPITIAIALRANEELARQGKRPIFVPSEMVRCDKSQFPGRKTPLNDLKTHKYLNMYMAIQKSSNIYPARLVQYIIEQLGPAWYRQCLVEIFGFGNKTGVELPYENPGLIPTPGKTYQSGFIEWSAPTPYSLAIGYNLMVNSIQMLRAYSVFANGGYLVQPTLLRKIAPKGDHSPSKKKENLLKKVLSEEIVREVVSAMKYATKSGGSAPLADIPGFSEVGKTSTAEKIIQGKYSKSKHFSSFIGFVPAKDPKFVLFVGMDEPEKVFVPGLGRTHMGGTCAAPVFREIAKRSLQYLGAVPDDPFGYPRGDPRREPLKADWGKEVETLNEIYQKWNG